MLRFRRFLPILALSALAACAAEKVQIAIPEPDVPASPSEMFFLGTWNCGVTEMTFAADRYTPSKGQKPIGITAYNVRGTTTDVTLATGEKISVQRAEQGRINWFSHQTGDTLACSRI